MKYDKKVINELLSKHLFQDVQMKNAYSIALSNTDVPLERLQINYFERENNAMVLQWITQQPGTKSFSINRFENSVSASVTSYSGVEVRASLFDEQADDCLLFCLLALTMAGVDVREATKETA